MKSRGLISILLICIILYLVIPKKYGVYYAGYTNDIEVYIDNEKITLDTSKIYSMGYFTTISGFYDVKVESQGFQSKKTKKLFLSPITNHVEIEMLQDSTFIISNGLFRFIFR